MRSSNLALVSSILGGADCSQFTGFLWPRILGMAGRASCNEKAATVMMANKEKLSLHLSDNYEIETASILALDLGTTTGWAVLLPDGSITSGTINFKPKRFEGGGMRYLRFSDALCGLHDRYRFDRILFEEVRRHAGTDAAHIYGGFMGGLMAWAEFRVIPYESVPVGTWKKAVVGKGNAGKSEVIATIEALGHSPVDDNEADALGVLTWFLTTRNQTFGDQSA